MNFELSDEQEFLREAARGALVARQDRRGRARGARRRRAARPVADGGRGRLAGPAGVRGARRRRARRVRRDARVRRSSAACSPACRCSATCRRRCCSTAAAPTDVRRSPPARCAPRSCRRGRRATSTTAGPSTRASASTRAPAPRVVDGGTRDAATRRLGARTRPAPTCSSWSRARRPRRSPWPSSRRRRVEPSARRYDATRSLGHVTLRRRARHACSTLGEATLAPAWYLAQALLAAESLGAVERALEMSRRSTRRSASRSAARSAPTRRSSTSSSRSCAGWRTPARCMYYAGWAAPGQAGGVRARGAAPRARRPARRSTTPRARRSPCTAASARRGSTTRRCYFRRAQLSRRLLGGTADAADRVAGELLTTARAA